MTSQQATAEVFLTGLRALPRKERGAVLEGIADDKDLREDLLDLVLIAQRRNEPSRLFRQYLADGQAKPANVVRLVRKK